jgi:hypothetical protein
LKAICIEVGEFIKEVLSGCWFDHTIEIVCLELPRKCVGGRVTPHKKTIKN